MKTIRTVFIFMLLPAMLAAQTVTLDDCLKAAHDNYPLIKKYDLIERTAQCTVSNINKGWLPQFSALAQATWQTGVAQFPEALSSMLQGQGYTVGGLNKDQYRVAVDVTQNVWDGGKIFGQKQVASLQGEVEAARNDVELYEVRSRVNELYFGTLLLDSRLQISRDRETLLRANLDRLRVMFSGGTAMRSEVQAMEAELLETERKTMELESSRRSLMNMLAIFCGIQPADSLQKPPLPDVPAAGTSNALRPELRLADSRIRLADARMRLADAEVRPRLALFAQGFYGYPGYDMFHDMLHHNWSFNAIVGAKITWNIGSLYTRRNTRELARLQKSVAANDRDLFLFNNKLEQTDKEEAVAKFANMLSADRRIVQLRAEVRAAAESKLRNGIVEVNNLLQEINRECNARNTLSIHEVEMLRQAYALKHTLNR